MKVVYEISDNLISIKFKIKSKDTNRIVKNGIDFLGYRHILTSKGRIIVKLRYSSKQRMKKRLKNHK